MRAQEGNWDGCWSYEKWWGVKKYVSDKYISDQLEVLKGNSSALEMAKMLCFKTICTGISNNKETDASCAINFAKEYPDIITKIVLWHPEYFKDVATLRAVIEALAEGPSLIPEAEIESFGKIYLNNKKVSNNIDTLTNKQIHEINEIAAVPDDTNVLIPKIAVDYGNQVLA